MIKKAIVDIIASFRGYALLTSSEVKIEELLTEGDKYTVKGTYQYHPVFGDTVEEGTFDITLDGKLKPVSSKVTGGKTKR